MNHELALDLRRLRSFVAVAERLHFGRAADDLRVAQPALSQQIRTLERDLGVTLLTRTSRSVALTPAGAVLHDRAVTLLLQAERAADETVRVGRGEQGRLDVGFVISALPLGPIARVHPFREQFPLVQVQLSEGYTSQLVGRVVRGELDLAIVRDPDPQNGVTLVTFRTERFVAVVPAGHRFASRSSIRGPELADEPFVFFPPEASALAVERNLAPVVDGGRVPDIVQVGSSWSTILLLIAAGVGVSVAPESALIAPPLGVVALPLEGTDATSTLSWVARADDDRAILRNFVSAA
jgi:DNA-binding transcriptional LysR family regulator